MLNYLLALILFVTISSSAQIEWQKFEEDSVKSSDKELILLYFTADWCTWCRQLNLKTFNDEIIIDKLNKSFYSAKINESNKYDLHTIKEQFLTGEEFAAKVGVKSYPTIIITDKSLLQLKKINGYVNPKDFLSIITEIESEYNK